MCDTTIARQRFETLCEDKKMNLLYRKQQVHLLDSIDDGWNECACCGKSIKEEMFVEKWSDGEIYYCCHCIYKFSTQKQRHYLFKGIFVN